MFTLKLLFDSFERPAVALQRGARAGCFTKLCVVVHPTVQWGSKGVSRGIMGIFIIDGKYTPCTGPVRQDLSKTGIEQSQESTMCVAVGCLIHSSGITCLSFVHLLAQESIDFNVL